MINTTVPGQGVNVGAYVNGDSTAATVAAVEVAGTNAVKVEKVI